MPVTIVGNNTPTAGGVVYGDGTNYASTAAGTSGQVLVSNGASAPSFSSNISGNAGNVTGTVAVANGGTGATSLTANNVVLGNGTSAVQFVAPGTNGNVLTSNGTTWTSTAPSGSPWVFINSTTASGSSAVDVTGMNSTYDFYMITIQNMSLSASSIFGCQFYLGGSLQTSSLYGYVTAANDTGFQTTADWANPATGDSRGRIGQAGFMDTGADYDWVFYVPNVNQTTYQHGFWGSGVRLRSARPTQQYASVNYNTTGSALTGIRFFMVTGTISGIFTLYGLKRS